MVDPVPEIDGFWFIDEVGASGWCAGGAECGFCGDVSSGGIFDIGDGDEVIPVANLTESAIAGCIEESGDQVVIPRSPNQMWSERAGEKTMFAGGIDDGLFGKGFGVGVVAEPAVWIGERFIRIEVVRSIEDDAGRARVDQGLNLLPEAGIDDVVCAFEIDTEVMVARSPNTGYGGGVENSIDVFAGKLNGCCVSDVALNVECTGGIDSGVWVTGEDFDGVSELFEEFDDMETEETSSAGDERAHNVVSCEKEWFFCVGFRENPPRGWHFAENLGKFMEVSA